MQEKLNPQKTGGAADFPLSSEHGGGTLQEKRGAGATGRNRRKGSAPSHVLRCKTKRCEKDNEQVNSEQTGTKEELKIPESSARS